MCKAGLLELFAAFASFIIKKCFYIDIQAG